MLCVGCGQGPDFVVDGVMIWHNGNPANPTNVGCALSIYAIDHSGARVKFAGGPGGDRTMGSVALVWWNYGFGHNAFFHALKHFEIGDPEHSRRDHWEEVTVFKRQYRERCECLDWICVNE